MIDSSADLMTHWPRMVAMARCFLIEADHTDWEDAAAAALEAALRHPESLARSPSVEGWLLQKTRWSALTARARIVREASRRGDAATLRRASLDAGSPSHVTTLIVRDALATLPPKLRRHADARMSGRSLREVGEYLGCSKRTAHLRDIAMRAALQDRIAPPLTPGVAS